MGDYQPIHSYAPSSRTHRRRPGSSFFSNFIADDRCLPTPITLLVLLAFFTVVFLSIDEASTLRHPWSSIVRSQAESTVFPTTPEDVPGKVPSSMSTDSLDAFLKQTKAFALEHLAAKANDSTPIMLIMGNEAGDLDSAASAISLSFLLTRFGAPAGYDLPASVYVPLIQSNHDDAVLRPENTAAFYAARIDPAQLLLLNDLQQKLGLPLDSGAFSPEAGVSIGLVDHPSLTGPWGGPKADKRKVDIIVDHHEDVGDHADAKLRIVKSPSMEPVGSAASLVANLYKDRLVSGAVPKEVADLLISAIVIDTDNLRPAPRGKATQTDFDAIKLLLPISSFAYPELSEQVQLTAFQHSPLNISQPSTLTVEEASSPTTSSGDSAADKAISEAKTKLGPFWEVLVKSKLMVSHLSGRDLLRRDYKEMDFEESLGSASSSGKLSLRLGFASVPISIVEWLHKDQPHRSLEDFTDPKTEVEQAWAEWWKTLDAFMEERKIDLAVMTGSFRVPEGAEKEAGRHKRELVLAFAPRTAVSSSQAETLWTLLRDGLERDAHVSPEEVERRLMLEQPWKGQRMPERAGGKRERVVGLDRDGRRSGIEGGRVHWAKVYKQANARANRKIVLPAVVQVLRNAAARL